MSSSHPHTSILSLLCLLTFLSLLLIPTVSAQTTSSSTDYQQCLDQCTDYNTTLPHQVKIGLYMTQITDLNPTGNNFFASGYFWLVWKTCSKIGNATFLPYQTIQQENIAQEWTNMLKVETACTDDPTQICPLCNTPVEGYSYVSYRFSAMYSTAFKYSAYPVDQQTLVIAFEDSTYNSSTLTIIPDYIDTQLHPQVSIPGFTIQQVVTNRIEATYATW